MTASSMLRALLVSAASCGLRSQLRLPEQRGFAAGHRTRLRRNRPRRTLKS